MERKVFEAAFVHKKHRFGAQKDFTLLDQLEHVRLLCNCPVLVERLPAFALHLLRRLSFEGTAFAQNRRFAPYLCGRVKGVFVRTFGRDSPRTEPDADLVAVAVGFTF